MAVDAGTIYSAVRIQLDKLKADISQTELIMDQFGKQLGDAPTKPTKRWTDSFKKINLAGVAAFAAIGFAVKDTVKTFATFEQSLANVRSVAQATDAEFAMIEKAALDAGEATRFTASQAADAMYYLASAGFDATQSVDALNGVLLLAGSTQSDLAQTAESVASAISQFNLDAKDAERVANVFTAAITNSQATMDKLAVSLRYVGPVASSMNKSIEDTVGLLQILYNNGFEASQAGTALRGALADLSNSASPAIKKLKDLGVSFDEVNPQTNTFADIIGVLNEKVTDGSDIMQIFGDRAGPALIKLIGAGRAEVEKYTKAITGTNAAAEAYAIQNDTLQGSLDLLKSAVESAQIKFTKEFAPAIRGVVDFITGLVKAISNIPGPLKVMIGIMTAAIPVVLGVVQAVKILSAAFTKTTGVIGAVITAIALIAALIIAFNDAKNAGRDLANALEDQRKETNNLAKEFNDLNAKTTLNANEKARLVEIEGELKSRIGETAVELDKETGKLKLNTSALQDYNEEQAKLAVQARKSQVTVAEQNLELAKLRIAFAKAKQGLQLTREEYELLNDVGKNAQASLGFAAEFAGAGFNANKFFAESYRLIDEAEKELIKSNDELASSQQILNDIQNPEDAARRKKLIEDEQKAKEAQIKREQEARAREQAAADAYRKSLEEINSIIDDEKGAYLKLQETLERLEKTRFNSASDEKKRIEAIGIIRKRIAEEDAKRNKDAIKYEDDYKKKLDELRSAAKDSIELEKQRAIEAIKSTNADVAAKQRAIDAVNEYYEALKDKTAQEEFEENNKKMFKAIEDGAFSIAGSITGLLSAITDARVEQLDRQLKAELEAAGVAEKTAVETAKAELDAALKTNDKELIDEKQKALTKAKIEEEYERKKANIRYQSEMAIWGITLAQTIAESARSIIQAVASAPWPFNLPAIGFASVAGALQTGIVVASQPQKPTFKTGGIVVGPSGIDNIDAKVSAGEMILNQEQQRQLFDIANGASGVARLREVVATIQIFLNTVKIAEEVTRIQNGGTVRLKT